MEIVRPLWRECYVNNTNQTIPALQTIDLWREYRLELAEWEPAFVERLQATDGVVEAHAEKRKERVELRLALSREELIAEAMATLSEAVEKVALLVSQGLTTPAASPSAIPLGSPKPN